MKINKFPKSVFIAACKFGLLKPQLKFYFKKITAGVSSDIWHVKTENNKEFCIKRALNKLTVKEDFFITIPRGQYDNLESVIEMDSKIIAPVKKGDQRGELKILLSDESIAIAPLSAKTSIPTGSIFNRLKDEIHLMLLD